MWLRIQVLVGPRAEKQRDRLALAAGGEPAVSGARDGHSLARAAVELEQDGRDRRGQSVGRDDGSGGGVAPARQPLAHSIRRGRAIDLGGAAPALEAKTRDLVD